MDERKNDRNDLIEGRNALNEAIRAGRPIDTRFVARGTGDSAIGRIISRAKDAGLAVVTVDRRKLDEMSVTGSHQGVIAVAAVTRYAEIEDIFALAAGRGEEPFVIVCDEISDVHNLGAIIRSAECAGAHGVIIPKRRSAGLTAVVDKTSAGAAEYLPVARVSNLPAAIDELKRRGLWVYGTAADGASGMWKTDLTGPIALIIGSEGEGMGRLVREKCDALVSIPMRGHIDSLNASAAAAVLIYEVLRQRLGE